MGVPVTIPLPFVGGIQEGAAAQYVDPSQNQADITNANLTKLGAANKRKGMGGLGTTCADTWNPIYGLPASDYTPTKFTRVASTKKAGALAFSDSVLYTVDEAADNVNAVGLVPNVQTQRRTVPSVPGAAFPQACDFGDDSRLIVYTDTLGSVSVSVVSRSTGKMLVPAKQVVLPGTGLISLAFAFATFVLGSKVAIVGFNASNTHISLVLFDPATATFSATVNLAPLFSSPTPTYFDVCPVINDPNNGFLLLANDPGTSTLILHYFDSAGAVQHSATVDGLKMAVSQPYVYCEYGASEWIWVSYLWDSGGGAWKRQLYTNSGDLSWSSPHTNTIGTGFTSDNFLSPIVRTAADEAWQAVMTPISSIAGTDISSFLGEQHHFDHVGTGHGFFTPLPFGFLPIGKPLVDHSNPNVSRVILPCAFSLFFNSDVISDHVQDSLYLLRCSSEYMDGGIPIATSLQRQLSVDNLSFYMGLFPVPFMSSLGSDGVLPDAAAVVGSVAAEDSAFNSGATSPASSSLQSVEYTFSQDLLFSTGELGDGQHIQSSVPYVFDGFGVFEDSFFYYPQGSYATAAGTGITGTYSYAVIYRWTGADGQEYKSSPYILDPITVTNKTITIHIPVYSASARDDIGIIGSPSSGNAVPSNPVFADIYRTVTLGATFYLLASVPATPVFLPSTASDCFVTFADANADTDLDKGTLLYTTGGRLDNVNPPALRCQTVHKNRVWGVDDTGQAVWFTQDFVEGDACGWNDDLRFGVFDGGDLTAIASLDDKLVLFKEDAIYIVYGDGPASSGDGSDLTVPQRIASDVGCLDWRSVVLTPEGVMFQAQQGIYLLDRGLNVTFVGKAVEDLTSGVTVVGAVLAPQDQQVRFVLDTQSIVYDYLHHAWIRHTYDQRGSAITTGCRNGDVTLMGTTGGRLLQERTDSFLDEDGSSVDHFVARHVQMPWVKIQGLQGYQRARRVLFLGERDSDHGFQFSVAVNGDPTVKQVVSYTADTLTKDQVAFHVGAALNKQQSMQITIDELAPIDADLGDGEGGPFLELRLEMQQIGDRYRQIKPGTTFHVDSVTPDTGSIAGGSSVTILGAGFTGATAVLFGAASVTPTVVNDRKITCVTPAHANGAVDVTVKTPRGKRTLASAFTFTGAPSPVVIFGADCFRSYEDVATGATWTDASGNYDTTTIGADPTLTMLTSGKVAYSFAGAQGLRAATPGTVLPLAALTAWGILDSSGGVGFLLGQLYNFYSVSVAVDVSGYLVATLSADGSTPVSVSSSPTVVNDGANHTWVLTYDGTNIALSVDGAAPTTDTLAGPLYDSSAVDSLGIGTTLNNSDVMGGSPAPFTGLISSTGMASVVDSGKTTQLQTWLAGRV